MAEQNDYQALQKELDKLEADLEDQDIPVMDKFSQLERIRRLRMSLAGSMGGLFDRSLSRPAAQLRAYQETVAQIDVVDQRIRDLIDPDR